MMSQRWSMVAELLDGGGKVVAKDEADAYATEVERLRDALREIRALDVNDVLSDAEAFDCVQTIAEAALNGKESQ